VSSRFEFTFLHYIGGKRRLVPRLLELLPPHRCYVEVFGGVAHLLLAKKPSAVEVYNDVDGRLVNLLKVVKERGQELQERLEGLLYSRRVYLEFLREPLPGDPLEDAVRFFYVIRSSFKGKWGQGWAHGVTRNHAATYSSAVAQLRLVQQRLRNVNIEELDFRECIKTYDGPRTLFFCDPPYISPEHYEHNFGEKDHEDLAELLRRVKGKWLLTYNDHPRIRHLYAGYPLMTVVRPVSTTLTRNCEVRGNWTQLIIANYELPSAPQFLKKSLFPERVKIPGTRPAFKSHGPKVRSS